MSGDWNKRCSKCKRPAVHHHEEDGSLVRYCAACWAKLGVSYPEKQG